MTDIADAEARAQLYGIADAQKVQMFGAYGTELIFTESYYRQGHNIKADPADLAGWSFSRNSVATFETAEGIQSFEANKPRIIEGVGLLMEPTGQNILLRSQDFDHPSWSKVATGAGLPPVVDANNANAPDGTMTADEVTLNLGGSDTIGDRSILQQSFAIIADRDYFAGAWVKGMTGEKILLRHAGGTGYSVHTFNGAWQNLRTTERGFTTGVTTFEIGLRGSLGATSPVTFHIWGAQAELDEVSTSYIPTTGSPTTRDPDSAIVSGLGFGTCTILIDATLTSGAANSEFGRRVFATLYAGSGASDNVTLVNNDAGGIGSVVSAAGALIGASTTENVAAKDERQQIALRIATDDVLMVRNGVKGSWLFDGAVPASLRSLHVGGSPLSTLARLGGVVHKVVIFPFAMTDSEMAVLTGGTADPVGEFTWRRITKSAAFPRRDSAETFVLNNYQYIGNGYQPIGVGDEQSLSDLWRSANGTDFELVNDDPDYDTFSKMVALDGTIYAWRQKMFKSTDGGTTFTQILSSLPWEVSGFDNPAIVHNGKLLFVHGTGNNPIEDSEGVWEFDPVEVKWTLICPAPWGARMVPMITEFDGDLYLLGGQRNVANMPPETTYPDKTTLNDLWKSTDHGATWTQIVATLPFAPRVWPAFITYAGRLYVVGGYDNIGLPNRNFADTWISANGTDWSQLFATSDYLQRHAPVAYVFNGELVLASGNANAAAPSQVLNDIWKFAP